MCLRSHDASAATARRAAARPGRLMAVAVLLVGALAAATPAAPRILRVAADPNNLPFTNDRGEGFENKIIARIATDLGATVEYTWRAQRRGFFRQVFKEGNCDLVAGVPRGFERALTTVPYYRSTYVLVLRSDGPDIRALDDPRLRQVRIGLEQVGDAEGTTPIASALARRGLVDNVRGFSIYGDYREANPPARVVDAVARGDVDVACVWGPLGGYFAAQHGNGLRVVPLPARDAATGQPFAFDICMGVRKSERTLRDELNAILARRKPEIDAILRSYGVPVIQPEGAMP